MSVDEIASLSENTVSVCVTVSVWLSPSAPLLLPPTTLCLLGLYLFLAPIWSQAHQGLCLHSLSPYSLCCFQVDRPKLAVAFMLVKTQREEKTAGQWKGSDEHLS